jgi:Flp pilus assembly protein TadG
MNLFKENIMRRFIKRLGQNESGVAAVEFAFVLPIMLIMYLGMVEVVSAINVDRKVTLLSRTLADLTSQAPRVDGGTLSNVFNASEAVLAPFVPDPTSPAQMVITSVVVDASGAAKVCWSEARAATADAIGSTVTLPTGLNIPLTSLILGTARVSYKPMIGYVITGNVSLNETTYMRPRVASEVTRAGSPDIKCMI